MAWDGIGAAGCGRCCGVLMGALRLRRVETQGLRLDDSGVVGVVLGGLSAPCTSMSGARNGVLLLGAESTSPDCSMH